MGIKLTELITRLPSDTEDRVEKARKRYNQILRDLLRQETGLRFNKRDNEEPGAGRRNQESIQVPIKVAPGLPKSIQQIEFEDSAWLSILLRGQRGAIEGLRDSTSMVQVLMRKILADSRGQAFLDDYPQDLLPVHDLAEHLLKEIQRIDPVTKILEVNEDVLGVYRYKLPSPLRQASLFPENEPYEGCIELYWGAIGLLAQWLGVDLESLTVVVLAHELAHAYTHLGADIDGERWLTSNFDKLERGLAEGLAQYYTARVCEKIKERCPGAHDAYQQLLAHQPEDYKTHAEWLEKFNSELVRASLLRVRHMGSRQLKDFNDGLLIVIISRESQLD